MAKNKKSARSVTQLSSERDLKKRIDAILLLGKIAGADETEVQVDETIDALTRFANNAIHQNVADHAVSVSIRTVVDGRTARVTTNRLDEDSLRAAVQSSLQLAHSQPKIPGLLPMPGKHRYRKVNRFSKETEAITPEDRARAVKKSCDLAIRNGQVAAGIFSTGQSQLALGNSRGLFAAHRQTRAEFSITMQDDPAASWAKANSGSVRNFDPQKLAAHPQPRGAPRSGRFSFLRFCPSCRRRPAVLLRQAHGQATLRQKYFHRSEERRVGKECRSRWSP